MSHNFAVFLSHNSREKPAVERIAEKLKRAGLEPWLDKWCLTPGGDWQNELAAGLRASSACAVFVGPNGIGSWEDLEYKLATDRMAKDRVFLVLLPGLAEPFDPGSLPPFLSTRTWVDLRKGIEDSRAFQLLINAIKGIAPGPEVPIEPRNDICPYRGLQIFEEEHAEFYFGREGDIQRLLEKLKATRFLAVIGPSGSGKSSLVRAGLIPRLRRGTLPDSYTWTIRVLTPGSHPLNALTAHLSRLDSQKAMHVILEEMCADAREFHLNVTRALSEHPPTELVVWVIDQFGEVFTLCRDEQERTQFLSNLLYAASIPDGRNVVVLTMRADFYPKCAAYPELSTHIAEHQFLVSPMSAEGLRQTIEEPARRVGLEFEEGLVGTILKDVENQPGALPLLEHALLELWERRRGQMLTLEAYRESGGVEGAIAKRANAIYASFSPEQQEIARRIMLRLTQPGEGTEDTRRRAEMSELITRSGESDTVEDVVRAMTDARLLMTGGSEEKGERLVDVSHEALIRGWPLLRKWIDEDRAGLRVHRRLTEAADEWKRLNRDEGILYRGARLAEAIEWQERNEASMNDLEREFLNESVKLKVREEEEEKERQNQKLENAKKLAEESEARRKAEEEARKQAEQRAEEQARATRRQRRLSLVLAVIFLLAAGAAVFALTQRKQAIAQRDEALRSKSRGLAVASNNNLNIDPERSILLALQAVSVTYFVNKTVTPEAEDALHRAVQASRVRLTLSGHTGFVYGVAFSPDGKLLATASFDGTARVYPLNIEDLVVLARKRVTRSLTPQECQKYLYVEQCPSIP